MSEHTRNERFLGALVEELQSMSDTDALEGENAEALVKLGYTLLTRARAVQINEGTARRVLEIVDAGLVEGLGQPIPGQMCVEAAVCYALGLPHDDNPSCVAPALCAFGARLNDAGWSTPQARAKGLRRLAIAQLGSAGVLDEREFVRRLARLAIQICVPVALRAEARLYGSATKERMLHAAELCEREPTRKHALDAANVANDAAANANAANAATNATNVAYVAAKADTYVAFAATKAAAHATANAADIAAYVAGDDTHLSIFAERVVQILIDMGAPGCAFLHLTEARSEREDDPNFNEAMTGDLLAQAEYWDAVGGHSDE